MSNRETICPVEATLRIIGGKWKSLIIWHLAQNRTLRFSEMKRIIAAVTQKMLTQQLRELEQDGMISRTVYPQIPPKVEYSLTDLGQTLIPVLNQMCQWGSAYIRRETKTRPGHPRPK